jgi:hypothetical protein
MPRAFEADHRYAGRLGAGEASLRRLSRKSELAKPLRYMRSRRKTVMHCFDDGRLALDNRPTQRALCCVAIGRKNVRITCLPVRCRRPPHRSNLLADRDRQAQQRQPTASPRRAARPHRRSPGMATCRSAAPELGASASRRRSLTGILIERLVIL